MTDKPTDSSTEEPEQLSQEVQDYLDVLLCAMDDNTEPEQQAAVESEADADEERQRPAVVAKGAPALTMVGGTALGASRPQPLARPPAPEEDKPKPFAEPSRPVTLRMPVVEVKPEPEPTAPAAEPEPPPPVPEAKTVEPPAAEAPAPVQAPTEPPVETPAEPEPVAETPQQGHATSEWLANGRPAWAQERFECLLFSVGGLTLAVPLVELGSIYPINDEITPLFGQADWFMGLLSVKDSNIKTVNTAKLVMPERYRDAMMERYAYVITINGVEWGLAVDTVSSAITLDPGDVRWRGERSKRPWLAGTVVDHMCALLDVSQLAKMFIDADHRKPRH